MGIFQDIGLWLWRLLPANPILVRVVTAGGKRKRHLAARFIYLAIMFVVMIVAQTMISSGAPSLATLAKDATNVFMAVSVVQLALMSFIAPIFTAGAITQERDSNTFAILLCTPMTDAQIVLGSLMSRLYFVWVLLLSGVPVICITMIYGGVTAAEVFKSCGLAATTALLTGSLAIAISVTKIGTQRTIFTFFMGIALYLLGVGALGVFSVSHVAEAPLAPGQTIRMSWLAPIHPFLALLAVTGQTPPPAPSDVYHYGWPARWLLAAPEYGYMVITTLASLLIILCSVWAVRLGTRTSDGGLLQRIRQRFAKDAGELRRKPRRVWNNPIAWREATTRGSAAGRSSLRWTFAVAGVLGGLLLLIAYKSSWGGMQLDSARSALTALIWIELAIILLVVTNTAAATLTRERDAGTMDLLLTTPMTSKYILAGMARGLVSFVIPLIIVPTVTVLLFVVADLFRDTSAHPKAVTTPEAVLLVPLLIIAFSALAAMIGLYRSLNSRKTTQAVMTSTAIVMAAAGVLSGCGYSMSSAGSQIAAAFLPFTPFPALWALVDYESACRLLNPSSGQLLEVRITRGVMSVISAAIYAFFVGVMYKQLVRNFDMTIRRQSA